MRRRHLLRVSVGTWLLASGWLLSLLLVGWAVAAWHARLPPLAPVYQLDLDPLTTPPAAYSWTAAPTPAFPMPPYARFLADATIVLDPGHGGRKTLKPGWKVGPTGLREAQVNLQVATFLRDFLTAAGARVVLTRDRDVYLERNEGADLRARARRANELPADAFVSLHHNAARSPSVNYSLVFYHDDPARDPASLALGRHLLTGLQDALRLEQDVPCALLSDKMIHANNGFGLLRAAEVPAVLVEASFFTNPAEETRLRDPVYLRRQAYGLFLGLARWAQAGLPRVRLAEPADGRVIPGGTLLLVLDDGLSNRRGVRRHEKILADSIIARLGDSFLATAFDPRKRLLQVTLPGDLRPGRRTLHVDFVNIFGQHVLHPEIAIDVRR